MIETTRPRLWSHHRREVAGELTVLVESADMALEHSSTPTRRPRCPGTWSETLRWIVVAPSPDCATSPTQASLVRPPIWKRPSVSHPGPTISADDVHVVTQVQFALAQSGRTGRFG